MSQQKKRGTPIHPKQIQIIKLAQKELGLDDDTYRALLQEMFGVDSCTRLSLEQANELIDELQRKGFRLVGKKGGRSVQPARKGSASRPRLPRDGNVVKLVSADELAKLEAVAALIEWQYQDGLARLLERRLHIKGGRVRTSAEAYRAIEMLKKIFEGQMKKAHGDAWWTMQFPDETVMDYIRIHKPKEWR